MVSTAILTFTFPTEVIAQQAFTHGQNVVPAFEGWERNPDGSFNMVFGFFNRNCEEVLHVPIGAGNNIEPGGPDRGQPTSFFPRRGKFIFKVQVPSNFGNNELVWTLTAHGTTEVAYATLRSEYVIDKRVTMMNEIGYGQRVGEGDNLYPVLRVDGETHRTVKVGEPLRLTAFASDDGLPEPRTDRDKSRLMAGWLVYRGNEAHVTFDPQQFNPDFRLRHTRRQLCRNVPPVPEWAEAPLAPDGKITVIATFSEPGTYVLRAMAHDIALKTTREITVAVTDTGPESALAR